MTYHSFRSLFDHTHTSSPLTEHGTTLVVLSKDGRRIHLGQPLISDFGAISMMTYDNFDYAKTYRSLSQAHRNLYKSANTPQKIAILCWHPENLLVLTAKSSCGKVVGFTVARRTPRNSAEICRMHVGLDAQNWGGVGGHLLQAVVVAVEMSGLSSVEVRSSGESCSFFKKKGFLSHGIEDAAGGVFIGVDAPPKQTLLVKTVRTKG